MKDKKKIGTTPPKLTILLVLFLGLLTPVTRAAVLVTNLAGFGQNTVWSLIQGRDGLLYGPMSHNVYGGAGGVFQMTPNGSVNEFASTHQNSAPGWLIQGNDGDFYGTAAGQFKSNYGTVFRFATNGTVNTLAVFNGTNGSVPAELVQTADGNFYGTTYAGGIGFTNDTWSGFGTLFKLDTNGAMTTLVWFNGTNGAGPGPLIVGSDGNLYGTTEYGGADTNVQSSPTLAQPVTGYGTAFVLHLDGTFNLATNLSATNSVGADVSSLILGQDGNVYGTARFGGLGLEQDQ